MTDNHMGNKKMFKDNETWEEYVQNQYQVGGCCNNDSGLRLSGDATERLYRDIVYPPIRDAGFVVEPEIATGRCSYCCAVPQVRRLRAGDWAFFRHRYGDLYDHPRSRLWAVGLKDYFQKYRDDCRMDGVHPDSKIDLDQESIIVPWSFRTALAGYACRGWEPWFMTSKRDWWGEHETALNDFEEEVPYSSLSLKELDYVIETHNAKWGKIKPISREGLDLNYIFPGQTM